MSTNSSIIVKYSDTEFRSIYVHYDGYLEGVGMSLFKHYNSDELAKSVISLGNLSGLYESMECPKGHTYDTPVCGYSIAYGRDRGENKYQHDAKVSTNIFQWMGQDYNYYWDGNDWYVSKNDVDHFIPLKLALI